MKRAALLFAVASIGGVGVLPGYGAQKTNSPTTAPASVKPISNTSNASAQPSPTFAGADIRNMFGNLANDALASKDLSKVTSHFDQADQQRIAKSSTSSQGFGTRLDAQIDTFSKTWKQKYSHDFMVKDSANTFGDAFVKLQEGSPAHDPQLVSAVIKATGEKSSSANPYSADSSIGLADVQSSGKLSEMQVPLVSQKTGDWRIQVPTTLTADKLRQNLTAELTDLNQHSAQWPAKEADAYREVSHRILMAVMDKTASGSSQASAKTESLTPAPNPVASKSAGASAKTASASSATAHKWWQFWHW